MTTSVTPVRATTREESDRARTRLPVPGQALHVLGAFLVYTFFAVLVTWPLVLHLGSTVYMYPSNPPGPADMGGSIAHLRELVQGYHNPFLPGRIHDFNAPDGLPIRWPLYVSSFPSTILLYVTAVLAGATAAYGLFVLLGYIATGLAMFLLIRWLTASTWISLIVGWAFAFFPFMIVNGEHPHFVHGWVLVVMAWRMLVLIERPTPRNGFFAGAATVLALSWTHYFILLGGVAWAALTATALALALLKRDLGRNLRAHLPAIGLVAAFLITMRFFLVSTFAESTLPANPLAEVTAGAAKPLMWLIPSADTAALGNLTRDTLASRGWIAVEWTLYLGVTVIALALVGTSRCPWRARPQPARDCRLGWRRTDDRRPRLLGTASCGDLRQACPDAQRSGLSGLVRLASLLALRHRNHAWPLHPRGGRPEGPVRTARDGELAPRSSQPPRSSCH